jgi:hypothetical protein
MRVALALILISGAVFAAQPSPPAFPDEAKAHHWRMLDTSPRARVYASWSTVRVTPVQFRKMQQQYRPHDFNVWLQKLRQLRPGMTEKEVLAILRPKEEPIQLAAGPGFDDTIVLDDAYFVDVFFTPWPHRMTYATTPLARTYEIKSDQKKSPKT